jgi:DNA-binding LacI/PurR family transcriptional regulator
MVARLKDVAQRAGVSIKTASNVVNEYQHVSVQTRQRVVAAIEELGYRPNLAARYLRRAPVGVIALEIPHLALSYFTELAEHAVGIAAEHGFMLLLDHTGGRHAGETLLARGLRPTLIDGAILNPLSLRAEELDPQRAAIPIVLIGERAYEGLYDHIMIDNVAAARDATRHLLAGGRNRIAAIGVGRGPRFGHTVRLRYTGFAAAMAEAGLPVDRRRIVTCETYRRRDGYEGVRRILARGGTAPDAIFCFNDEIALGALRALHEAGLSVPGDVAVIGIDDIEEGRFSLPLLSSISPDKERIARLAVGFLVERIRGTRTGPPERVEVPYELVARESTLSAGGAERSTARAWPSAGS